MNIPRTQRTRPRPLWILQQDSLSNGKNNVQKYIHNYRIPSAIIISLMTKGESLLKLKLIEQLTYNTDKLRLYKLKFCRNNIDVSNNIIESWKR